MKPPFLAGEEAEVDVCSGRGKRSCLRKILRIQKIAWVSCHKVVLEAVGLFFLVEDQVY